MLAHGGGNFPRSEEDLWSDSSSLSWKAGEARDDRVASLLRSLRGKVGQSDISKNYTKYYFERTGSDIKIQNVVCPQSVTVQCASATHG